MIKPLVKRTDSGVSFDHSDIYKIAERLLDMEETQRNGAYISSDNINIIIKYLEHVIKTPSLAHVYLGAVKVLLESILPLAKNE